MNEKVWREIVACAGAPGAAGYVQAIGIEGSVPQRLGAAMVVDWEGRLTGTIGGGAVEYKVLRLLNSALAEGRLEPHLLEYNLVKDMGMQCGGSMTFYLEPVLEGSGDWAGKALELTHTPTGGVLATVVAGASELPVGRRWLISAAEPAGASPEGDAPPERISLDGARAGESGKSVLYGYEDGLRVFYEVVMPRKRLILFGAGHISAPLARMGKLLGFSVTVMDYRPEWACPERYPDADAILVGPFDEQVAALEHRPSDHLVIFTHGHAHDFEILTAVLEKPYAYLGLIGSRRKIKIMLKELASQGRSRERLEALHAPIGLNIGARTPEEIALSIAAELVAEQYGVDTVKPWM